LHVQACRATASRALFRIEHTEPLYQLTAHLPVTLLVHRPNMLVMPPCVCDRVEPVPVPPFAHSAHADRAMSFACAGRCFCTWRSPPRPSSRAPQTQLQPTNSTVSVPVVMLANPHPCRYEKGGPAAEARFEAGVAGFEARAFRGCGIMTSEPFEVSDGALTRRTTLALCMHGLVCRGGWKHQRKRGDKIRRTPKYEFRIWDEFRPGRPETSDGHQHSFQIRQRAATSTLFTEGRGMRFIK